MEVFAFSLENKKLKQHISDITDDVSTTIYRENSDSYRDNKLIGISNMMRIANLYRHIYSSLKNSPYDHCDDHLITEYKNGNYYTFQLNTISMPSLVILDAQIKKKTTRFQSFSKL